MLERRTMSLDEWNKLGEKLFGPERLKWRFVCPSCPAEVRQSDERVLCLQGNGYCLPYAEAGRHLA
jgi:hypothetical protein